MDESASIANEADELPCLPAGSVIGGYVLHECVGRGAMAHIYRAEHSVLGREVALKILAPSLMADRAARNRLLREARVTATLKHPNIIDVSDARFHEGNPYLIMDLLCGEDLQSRLTRDTRLPHEETVELGLALASALGAAHARGIVHRDIKPGNVFLARGADGEIVPKLLDFGISRPPLTLTGSDLSATPRDELLGSPLYLSPEGVLGASNLDPRSDQYALGVLLYECVTGRPPYLEDTLFSLFKAIARGVILPPSEFVREVPPALERVILRALSRDPTKRFENMQALGAALLEGASPRTRVIWSLTFGVRDAERPTCDTAPALSLDRTTKLKRPRRRQPLKGLLSASVLGIPALYAFWHAIDAEPLQRDTDGPWPSAAVRAPLILPSPELAPPELPDLAPAMATLPAVAPGTALAPVPAKSAPGAASAQPATVTTAGPLEPARAAKKHAAAATKASAAKVDGMNPSLALTSFPGAPAAARAARTNNAGASAVPAEQDEVRKLFFSAGQRSAAVAAPSPRRAALAAEKLAR
jgi:serine/threonine protein kinase